MRLLGQASVRQVADRLGRSPESLQYHFKALVVADLIRLAHRRSTGKKPEAVYEPTSEGVRLPDLKKHPELADLTRKTVEAGMRQDMRGFKRAAEQAEADDRLRKLLQVRRSALRLSDEDVQEFFRMLDTAVAFAKDRWKDDGNLISYFSIAYPDT